MSRVRITAVLCAAAGLLWRAGAVPVSAAIDTASLEEAWPKEKTSALEVGKYPIQWRQSVTKEQGIRISARFTAPLPMDRTSRQIADYTALKSMVPGVTTVRRTEESAGRQVVEMDAKVLWKTLRLAFEVEPTPPDLTRFHLLNERLGDYRGLCRLRDAGQGRTDVEMITALKPTIHLPMSLRLLAERRMFLTGIRNFLDTCDHDAAAAARP